MKSTPWGQAQHATQIAPGIIQYSTAGHGGIQLSIERLAAMPAGLRMVRPYAGPGWYEEDLDWALVALAFPDCFKPASVAAAVQSIAPQKLDSYLASAAAWLAGPEGAAVRRIATDWVNENADLYRLACSGSIPRRHEALAAKFEPATIEPFGPRRYLTWALLRRISDGAEAEALLWSDEDREPVHLASIQPERIIRQPA
jgi:hypothetical protein